MVHEGMFCVFLCHPIERTVIMCVRSPYICQTAGVGGGVSALDDARTHIFDLFHGEVGIRRNADRLRSHVDNDHHGSRNVPLEQLVNLQIRCSQFRPRVVPTDHTFPCCTTTTTGLSEKFHKAHSTQAPATPHSLLYTPRTYPR